MAPCALHRNRQGKGNDGDTAYVVLCMSLGSGYKIVLVNEEAGHLARKAYGSQLYQPSTILVLSRE